MGFTIVITKGAITKMYQNMAVCPAFVEGNIIAFDFDGLHGVIDTVTWVRLNEVHLALK